MVQLKPDSLGWILVGLAILLLAILGVVKVEMDRQAVFLCEAVAADPGLEMEDCPAHQSTSSWWLVGAFGIAFLVLGSGLYMLFSSVEEKGKGVKKIDTSKFSKEEKGIYELLQRNEGSMYQSDLIKEMNFSEVKMTRILDKMETKGIIDRKRRGMTNIVIVK